MYLGNRCSLFILLLQVTFVISLYFLEVFQSLYYNKENWQQKQKSSQGAEQEKLDIKEHISILRIITTE